MLSCFSAALFSYSTSFVESLITYETVSSSSVLERISEKSERGFSVEKIETSASLSSTFVEPILQ